MRDGETPAILGAPNELKILTNWEGTSRGKGRGIDKQSPLREREGFGWRREGVVEVPVVLLSDSEACHVYPVKPWEGDKKKTGESIGCLGFSFSYPSMFRIAFWELGKKNFFSLVAFPTMIFSEEMAEEEDELLPRFRRGWTSVLDQKLVSAAAIY